MAASLHSNVKSTVSIATAGPRSRWSALRFGSGRLGLLPSGREHAGAWRLAGSAFAIRAIGAVVVYLSQILMARWMGPSEFGVYVYVWTWVLLLGDTIHLGLASAAQRFIPQYAQQNMLAYLRGFLRGSRCLVFAAATAIAALGALGVFFFEGRIARYEIVPLYLACATLPFYALSNMLDGMARAYDRMDVALAPPYVLRPLLLVIAMVGAHALGAPMSAATAMIAALVATWATSILQLLLLDRHVAAVLPRGERQYDFRGWFSVSLPILVGWGFYTLLTYTDVIMLQWLRAPAEVAQYFAASKTLAFVAFVYFAVSAAVAHKFTAYHVAGDRAQLASFLKSAIRWTFWPSLGAAAIVLAVGPWLLALFGEGFRTAYPLMFILALGLLARASVGPAERLISMLGAQRLSAVVYASAFAVNVLGCLLLVPRFGATGAAISVSAALVTESLLMFLVARRKLGLHLLPFGSPGKA